MAPIRRIFVEKKEGFNLEGKRLFEDLKQNLHIENLEDVRVINRYDLSGVTDKNFKESVGVIFSEPPVDNVYEELELSEDEFAFGFEYLPGQYDQRADWARQCLKILSPEEEPTVKFAKIILLKGDLDESQIEKIKKYSINAVDSKEAELEMPSSLEVKHEVPSDVSLVDGFVDMDQEGLEKLRIDFELAMSGQDLVFCQDYFKNTEKRNPSMTEIKVIDTYWSDHCRHTTFNTIIEDVRFEDGRYSGEFTKEFENYKESSSFVYENGRDLTLMNMATMAMKELRKKGKLDDLEVSDEINACSIVIDAKIDSRTEKWLLMFKNETHNHPTEIEPFGGAATCLGGAIRDPLSGRSYVYQAMRVTGSADPRQTVEETLEGKLPQRKITTGAAKGYSSYGNEIGLSTGLVREFYHEDFVAKRMEVGAVIGAVKQEYVKREKPQVGDVIVLLGGKTGRDGCGGATGSSMEHDASSIETCSAQVQKGNPPEERKIQRLFRNPDVTKMIKKCNDFGAGGVCVAIGELADSLEIDLDQVSKKYEGLDGTELAISESQERMAVVLDKDDVDSFIGFAEGENLEAKIVAKVTDSGRLKMNWRGKDILDISRDFLETNGVTQKTKITACGPDEANNYFDDRLSKYDGLDMVDTIKKLSSDLNICSQKGLGEMFDSSIGAASVLMPFGGKHQLTPANVMACKLPVLGGESKTASLMSFGYDPYLSKWSPFHGSMYSVIDSVNKIACAGGRYDNIRLSFQEYFEKLGEDPKKWGKPFLALLGAFKVQREFGIPAIGGKDSMSGTFKDISVPPTLISFAVDTVDACKVISNEYKKAGSLLVHVKPEMDENFMPDFEQMKMNFDLINKLNEKDEILSANVVGFGGVMESVIKSSAGNKIGVRIDESITKKELIYPAYGSFVLELDKDFDMERLSAYNHMVLGNTTVEESIFAKGEEVKMDDMIASFKSPLESVFKTELKSEKSDIIATITDTKTSRPSSIKLASPRVFIPAFPGTNCEYDTQRAFELAGGKTNIEVIRNLRANDIEDSVERIVKNIKKSQIIALPGGFSAGDEPDGSSKFIATLFRHERIKEAIDEFLNKNDGLMIGICNGFQALVKLGLVPHGDIRVLDQDSPTLTYNEIGRHMSKIVNTKVVSNKSPWFSMVQPGDVHQIPISHGEGRFVCSDEMAKKLFANGQVATQYVDFDGKPSYDVKFNPNGSYHAIEGITSPDGRVLGKMGHSERIGDNLYKNINGSFDQKIFESGVKYFK